MIYVIVGGGIAGVSCTDRLLQSLNESHRVILISASRIVKMVSHYERIGRCSERFDVKECEMISDNPRFDFIHAKVYQWNHLAKELFVTDRNDPVKYDKLCIATGAQPHVPFQSEKILTIRDTESAEELQRRLKEAKHVAVVGNGGIATEVVFEMKGMEITWIIRNDSVSSVFFDAAIAKFFQNRLESGRKEGGKNVGVLKRPRYMLDDSFGMRTGENLPGCALGPDWLSSVSFDRDSEGRCVDIIHNVEVLEVTESNDDVTLSLSDGRRIQCDFVIWATGVSPMTSFWKNCCQELRTSTFDGGILVDDYMCTSVPDVYACGDVCTVVWSAPSNFWKQMRLWTQARQMGDYCARSMISNGTLDVDFCFEIFTHTTSFFGYKVVFLGDFKGERQSEGWYTIDRVIEDNQFVRCIMYDHRVVGAVLVGETDLEETIENLILNKTDLKEIENDFLSPQIDIEDYFD